MNLEAEFNDRMLEIHRRAGELDPPYAATGFLSMVRRLGGKETADRLLAKTGPSDGFTELFIRGRENLRLSVEYLVLCMHGVSCSPTSSLPLHGSVFSITSVDRLLRIWCHRFPKNWRAKCPTRKELRGL